MGEEKTIPHIFESKTREAYYVAEMARLALQRMRGELVKAGSTTTITPEMIHEAEAHLPFEVSKRGNTARWEWLAGYLNKAVGNPDTPCSCCGVTPNGDIPGDEPAAPGAPQTDQVTAWRVPEVLAEIERATSKFPTWPTDPLHALAVLGEEFGELTKATLQTAYEPHKVKWDELRSEAVQTAAMALRFLTSLDRYEFRRCEQHVQQRAASETQASTAAPKFNVGDKVRVARKVESFANGWDNTWAGGMDAAIGCEGVITGDGGFAGFNVTIPGNQGSGFRYPAAALELVADERPAWEVAMESGSFTFRVRTDHTTIDYTATRNPIRWTVTWISPSTGQQESLGYSDEIVRDLLSNGGWQLIDPPNDQAEQPDAR